MPDILHDFPVRAPLARVFEAVSSPRGLDAWWTKRAAGTPEIGAEYELGFGPDYEWRAEVTRCTPGSEFELRLTRADADWDGTRVAFRLEEGDGASGGTTRVRFSHSGWPAANDHYRTSCYCWAMYLRLLARHVERGEVVPYEERLDA